MLSHADSTRLVPAVPQTGQSLSELQRIRLQMRLWRSNSGGIGGNGGIFGSEPQVLSA